MTRSSAASASCKVVPGSDSEADAEAAANDITPALEGFRAIVRELIRRNGDSVVGGIGILDYVFEECGFHEGDLPLLCEALRLEGMGHLFQ